MLHVVAGVQYASTLHMAILLALWQGRGQYPSFGLPYVAAGAQLIVLQFVCLLEVAHAKC